MRDMFKDEFKNLKKNFHLSKPFLFIIIFRTTQYFVKRLYQTPRKLRVDNCSSIWMENLSGDIA